MTQVEETIASDSPSQPIDMTSLLAQMNNYLQGLSAPAEAEIVIITGGQASTDAEAVSDRIGPTMNLVTQSGWEIITVTVPGTDPGLKSVLDDISLESGGESFELSVPEGYETIADRILRRDGSGSLANLGRSIMDDDSVFEVPIDVAPGTSELDMVFFRELPITEFRLTNPDGFESSTGDRRSSTIDEFHHVVFWKLEDPVPGRWNLEVPRRPGTLLGERALHQQLRHRVPVVRRRPCGAADQHRRHGHRQRPEVAGGRDADGFDHRSVRHFYHS